MNRGDSLSFLIDKVTPLTRPLEHATLQVVDLKWVWLVCFILARELVSFVQLLSDNAGAIPNRTVAHNCTVHTL